MRTTITKTVSMMLVTVMVLGVVVMPMRANAAFEVSQTFGANPFTLTLDIINLVMKMGVEMTSGVNQGQPLPETVSSIAAFWEPYVTSSVILLTQQQMSELVQDLKTKGVTCELYRNNLFPAEYMCIRIVSLNIAGFDFTGEISFGSYYTYDGRTVVCKVDSSSASQNPTNKFTEDDGAEQETVLVIDPETQKLIEVTVTNAVQNAMKEYLATINVTNNTAYNPTTNTYNNYTDMSYNPTTKTYQVNFADNRSYEYNFYYDYTYITYIGSSAEYREAYKVYYELPDGRSSGDLTADELKGISLQFDMVNYDKASSDTMTRALYDFDGDLDNSSAFNSSAQWISGASTTYLEAPDGFGGALFNNNPFDLRFSLDGVSNEAYTVQFRLYFENLPTTDFYVYAYGNPWWFLAPAPDASPAKNFGLLSFTMNLPDVYMPFLRINQGNVFFAYGDNVVATIQPGQWYDFAICFDWNTYSQNSVPSSLNALYLYINGLLSGTGSIRAIGYYSYYVASSSPYYYMETGLRRYGNDFTYFSFTGTDYLSVTLPGPAIINGSTSSYGYTDFWAVTSLWRSNYHLQLRSSSGIITNNGNFIPPYEFNSIGFRCDGSYTMMLDNLRVVNHSLYTGVSSFTPSPVPFDTNLVYVLPSVADLNDNTVAIMSQLPVSGYRVGGIRPTDPTLATGYIYMHIDGDFVDSVQQWNGAYWEEVTARLYTGIRWIPVTAFNVFTLEDMFDIIDPDADGSGPGVDSIFQYYLWWSGEWGTFQEWLKGTMQTLIEAIQASGGGGGSTDAPVVIVPGVNDQTTTSEITTENPDGSTTKTTIVSNAAGLVYSNSVTTYPTDVNGNTKTITVYTDSSGVMYQTETIIDKDGNVTVTEPTKVTGTLGSILKMITGGVMEIAGTVIEGFVTIVVDGVKFIIEAADGLFEGIGDLFTTMFGAVTDFTDSVQDFVNPPGTNSAVDGDDDEQGDGDGGQAINIFDAFFQVLPDWLVTGVTLCFVMMIVFPLMNKIHF